LSGSSAARRRAYGVVPFRETLSRARTSSEQLVRGWRWRDLVRPVTDAILRSDMKRAPPPTVIAGFAADLVGGQQTVSDNSAVSSIYLAVMAR